MARQQATFQNLKSIAAGALVGLGLAILFGKLCADPQPRSPTFWALLRGRLCS
jgi:hypothetical protein